MVTKVYPLAQSQSGAVTLTLVRFRIITGRKHQIRVQASRHGHALPGDTLYGGRSQLGGEPFPTYCLHAWVLRFPEDRPEGVPERLLAPPPAAFAEKIARLFGADALAHIVNGDLYWEPHDELQ